MGHGRRRLHLVNSRAPEHAPYKYPSSCPFSPSSFFSPSTTRRLRSTYEFDSKPPTLDGFRSGIFARCQTRPFSFVSLRRGDHQIHRPLRHKSLLRQGSPAQKSRTERNPSAFPSAVGSPSLGLSLVARAPTVSYPQSHSFCLPTFVPFHPHQPTVSSKPRTQPARQESWLR